MLNIKTTQEIKRGNDYKFKKWVEVTDVYIFINNLMNDLMNRLGNIKEELNTPETKSKDVVPVALDNANNSLEELDSNLEITDKLKELNRRVLNLNQSNTKNKEKIDRVYGELSIKVKDLEKTTIESSNFIDTLFTYITQINDKIKVLEENERRKN